MLVHVDEPENHTASSGAMRVICLQNCLDTERAFFHSTLNCLSSKDLKYSVIILLHLNYRGVQLPSAEALVRESNGIIFLFIRVY